MIVAYLLTASGLLSRRALLDSCHFLQPRPFLRTHYPSRRPDTRLQHWCRAVGTVETTELVPSGGGAQLKSQDYPGMDGVYYA